MYSNKAVIKRGIIRYDKACILLNLTGLPCKDKWVLKYDHEKWNLHKTENTDFSNISGMKWRWYYMSIFFYEFSNIKLEDFLRLQKRLK